MEHTANFGLTQWEKTDRIQMEDFNADNAKIEAALSLCGNCRMVTGTYTGSGSFGENAPTGVSFDEIPEVLFVAGDALQLLWIRGCSTASVFFVGTLHSIPVILSGTSVSWYYAHEAAYQMNTQDTAYSYCALFRADK